LTTKYYTSKVGLYVGIATPRCKSRPIQKRVVYAAHICADLVAASTKRWFRIL